MHHCVGALILQNEFVLLGKRSADRVFYPNVWDVFGGHIEPGESHREALQRELKEELGILPGKSRYLETLVVRGSTGEDTIECHFYVVTEWIGTLVNQQPQEHSEIEWFSLRDLPNLELPTPEYRRILHTVWKLATRLIRHQGRSNAG